MERGETNFAPFSAVQVPTRPHAIRRSNVSLKCSVCQRRFPSFIRLQSHLKLVHKRVEKLFRCSKCSLFFNDVPEFVRHTRNSHLQGEKHETVSDLTELDFPTRPVTRNCDNSKAEENPKSSKFITLPIFQGEQEVDGKEDAYYAGDLIADGENLRFKNDVKSKERSQLPRVYQPPADSKEAYPFVNQPQENITAHANGTGTACSKPNRGFGNGNIVSSEKESDFQEINQSSEDFHQSLMTESLLAGHPTMADIGKALRIGSESSLQQSKNAAWSQRRVKRQILRDRSKISCQTRKLISSGALKRPNSDRFATASNEALNLNVPSLTTVNLISNVDCNAKAERAEILAYLRKATVKLDAVIRHFNVPFSDFGSGRQSPVGNGPKESSTEQQCAEAMITQNLSVHCERLVFKKNVSQEHASSSSNTIKTNSLPDRESYHTCKSVKTPVNSRENEACFNQMPKSTTDLSKQIKSQTPNCRVMQQIDYGTRRIRLSEEKVQDIHSKSLNRGNFAKHLVFNLFPPEERKGKNCFGRKRPPLDPVRLQYVREKVFQYYPCESDLHDTLWRRQCVIAIDTALRCENRPNK